MFSRDVYLEMRSIQVGGNGTVWAQETEPVKTAEIYSLLTHNFFFKKGANFSNLYVDAIFLTETDPANPLPPHLCTTPATSKSFTIQFKKNHKLSRNSCINQKNKKLS